MGLVGEKKIGRLDCEPSVKFKDLFVLFSF